MTKAEPTPAPQPPSGDVVRLDVEGQPPTAAVAPVAGLLFVSGLCALVYQVAWLRELRLVFGASTAASATVLAIFMGGLGVGAFVFGRIADRSRDPLALFAILELAIAATAASTSLLLWGVRSAYVAAGGAAALELVVATMVLAAPTIFMGGTLRAAARAVRTRSDDRRLLAALYGASTLGALTGALLTTFVLLEMLGTRQTLWTTSLVNMLVGIAARNLAGTVADAPAPR